VEDQKVTLGVVVCVIHDVVSFYTEYCIEFKRREALARGRFGSEVPLLHLLGEGED
jgi:hypothetical protein